MKKGIILIRYHSFHQEHQHADIDRDDASIPYASENEVSPVGTRLVVLYAYSTPGSFSTHLPFALFRLLYRLSGMMQLLISTWPLP